MAQWLQLPASHAEGEGLILGQRTKIPDAVWHGQKNRTMEPKVGGGAQRELPRGMWRSFHSDVAEDSRARGSSNGQSPERGAAARQEWGCGQRNPSTAKTRRIWRGSTWNPRGRGNTSNPGRSSLCLLWGLPLATSDQDKTRGQDSLGEQGSASQGAERKESGSGEASVGAAESRGPKRGLACMPAQSLSCVWLCDPTDCGPPGSSVHGILQARILERVVMPFSRGSSQPRNWTHISCISCMVKWILYHLSYAGRPSQILWIELVMNVCIVCGSFHSSCFVCVCCCCCFWPAVWHARS